jgi:threonine aldolase
LYALEHNVDRLADDHANAGALAAGLAAIPGIEIDPAEVETNIVIFEAPDAAALVAGLAEREIELSRFGDRVRAVTHLDVDAADVERTLTAVAELV